MRLVANWQAVLKHAWSVRLMFGALLFMILDAAFPYVLLPLPGWLFKVLGVLLAVAAIGARLVIQRVLQTFINDIEWETGDGHDKSR